MSDSSRLSANAGSGPGAADIDNCEKSAMLDRIVKHCRKYQGADLMRSLGQAALSLGLYALLMGLVIYFTYQKQYAAMLAFTLPAAGLLVKLFTIQHDCGHGSYFSSRTANHFLGFVISVLTFTPYGFWRDAHNRHHASSGHLDRRGVGGVDTLTVAEYRNLTIAQRVMYRAYRHPFIMIVVGAPLYFFVLQRFPLAGAMPFLKEYGGLKFRQIWKSVFVLNIALIVFYGMLSILFGPFTVLVAFAPVITIASWAGAWLFFVQHQYENAYWEKGDSWNYNEAAVFGSSHYDLPTVLQWLSGNIGFHHIHHLSSLIPNYRLQECYEASRDLMSLPKMNILDSVACSKLALWDEASRKMISFKSLKSVS